MRQNLFLIAFSVISIFSYAQDVHIVKQNEDFDPKSQIDQYVTREHQERFEYIDEAFDMSKNPWVAVLQGYTTNTKRSDLEELFEDFWWESNVIGANAFKVDSQYTISDTTHVIITVYYFTESDADINLRMYPTNMIYVFGDLNKGREKPRKIKFNDQKLLLNSLDYFSYQNKVSETVSIVSGIRSFDIKGLKKTPSCYFSVKGINIGPPSYTSMVYAMGFGVVVGVGVVIADYKTLLPPNFGRFLFHFMNERELEDLKVIEAE